MLNGSSSPLGAFRTKMTSIAHLRTLDAKVLAGCLVILAGLSIFRVYDYWTTGFFVSDEFGYYYNALTGGIYGGRWFFGWMNIYLFRALGITNVDEFSYMLPFYLFFWAGVTMITFHRILGILGFDRRTISLSLVSAFALISFVLLSLGFLTEPVGLCFAMLGIYCLLRCSKSNTARGMIAFPILAATCFGAAAGTREPYEAFLIGGMVIVALVAISRRKDNFGKSKFASRTVLSLAVLLFALTSIFFLTAPTQAFSTQVAPVSSQLAQSLITNPTTSVQEATTTVTRTTTNTVTNTETNIVTVTSQNKTFTTTTTVTATTTSVSTSVGTTVSSLPFYRQSLLANTVLIFIGGIILGGGPICFLIGLAGFLILLRMGVRSIDLTARVVLLSSLVALGSYFVVSFIFAPDPYYFSFENYSTIIRFSDTALPAYFLVAPFFLTIIAKNRTRVLSLLGVLVVFLLIAVPVYEGYAASNIHYTSQNPFDLGYRSDAALIRNYFSSTEGNQTINLVGQPYGWTFTPGVQNLRSVHAYSIGESPLLPHLAAGNFTSARWSDLYLFTSSTTDIPSNSSSLLGLITQMPVGNSTLANQFTITGGQKVLEGPDFVLYEVQLGWQ
jgi:hypothetical protein